MLTPPYTGRACTPGGFGPQCGHEAQQGSFGERGGHPWMQNGCPASAGSRSHPHTRPHPPLQCHFSRSRQQRAALFKVLTPRPPSPPPRGCLSSKPVTRCGHPPSPPVAVKIQRCPVTGAPLAPSPCILFARGAIVCHAKTSQLFYGATRLIQNQRILSLPYAESPPAPPQQNK